MKYGRFGRISMSQDQISIDDLRREIDVIDEGIHDLLMRRAEIAQRVGRLKERERAPVFRPAREAEILRRLVARHSGPLPVQVVVRIWRELLSALTRLQGPFAVAVFVPEGRPGYWDTARDHFGGIVPMIPVNSPLAAIRAVSEGSASVGIVPYPTEDEADPWWRHLMYGDAATPRIVARLPFGERGNGLGGDNDAVVVGFAPFDPSGDDHSMLGVEVSGDISRGRFKDALDAAGLRADGIRSWRAGSMDGASVHLVEVTDHVAPDDARLHALVGRLSEHQPRVSALGGYAVPPRHHHTEGR